MVVKRYTTDGDLTIEQTHKKLIDEATINAADMYGNWLEFLHDSYFNLSVSGSFTGTPRLEISFDGGVSWLPAWSGTANAEAFVTVYVAEPGALWRAGFATGGITAGSATFRMSQMAI